MKDLYTFDTIPENAICTYREVSNAYRAFFADLQLPVHVAEASSGDMGGDHSHEYLLTSPIGEDDMATCGSCGYTASAEVAVSRPLPAVSQPTDSGINPSRFGVWRGITKDRRSLVNAWYPQSENSASPIDLNIHAVKQVVPELDTSIGNPLQFLAEAWTNNSETLTVLNVVDSRVRTEFAKSHSQLPVVPTELKAAISDLSRIASASLVEAPNLLRIQDGDGCPRCETGSLRILRGLELGHTFYLGTRYTEPLGLLTPPQNGTGAPVPVQMGCYGIGVSRIFGAVAEHLADGRGLNWPRAIAPYEVVIVPSTDVTTEVLDVYDSLAAQDSARPSLDVILDDREARFGWKMRDADTIGYPVIVVLGRTWREGGDCEVQCRRLAVQESVPVADLREYLERLLMRL
ncbi:hypothetical protein HIM_01238 [Hirsutella minnesotensis 3608]|nr:hypothetical protein HIM_01238 [Hirsutella minnesotensis 3608]